jgi:hypothetical protein
MKIPIFPVEMRTKIGIIFFHRNLRGVGQGQT